MLKKKVKKTEEIDQPKEGVSAPVAEVPAPEPVPEPVEVKEDPFEVVEVQGRKYRKFNRPDGTTDLISLE